MMFKRITILMVVLIMGIGMSMAAMDVGPTCRGDTEKTHSTELGEELLVAAKDGNLDKARELFERGVDVNFADRYGETPLKTAACYGHLEIVRFLLDNGGIINCEKYHDSTTALMRAADLGHVEIVLLLIDRGACATTECFGITALEFASWRGHREMYKPLIDAMLRQLGKLRVLNKIKRVKDDDLEHEFLEYADGSNLSWQLILQDMKKAMEYDCELSKAAQDGNQVKVQKLLENRAQIRYKDDSAEKALIKAAERGHLGIVRLLLENGAQVNYVNDRGETALQKAVFRNEVKVAELLLANGAQVNMSQEERVSSYDIPLICAVKSRHLDVVRLLLEHGALVNQANNCGDTALITAMHWGGDYSSDVMHLLVQYGAQVTTNKEGKTALAYAAKRKNLSQCKFLIDVMHNCTRDQKKSSCALLASLNRKYPCRKNTNCLVVKDLIALQKDENKWSALREVMKIESESSAAILRMNDEAFKQELLRYVDLKSKYQ